MIKKIIVEMDDAEVTFHEFNNLTSFQESDVYKQEVAPTVEATPVVETAEPVVPEAPVEPAK